MSADRLEILRQSFEENRHLAVTLGLIPIEVPLEVLKDSADARGYVIEGKTDEDGGGIYPIHKRGEKFKGWFYNPVLFDMRGELGLVGLFVQAWDFNKFKEIFFIDESDNQ